jgi:predicted permease
MHVFIADIRYSLRMLAKNPGFTAVAVLTLAIGSGAGTTVFSWIDAVLLHPLGGVSHPEQLMAFETVTPDGQATPTSYPDYRDFRDYLHLNLAMARPTSFSIGEQEHAERVWGELVSGNFFDVLGVRPVLGRVFLREEFGDKPNGFPVAVISQRYWRAHFHADPNVIGRTITVNRQAITVVGIAPADFHGSMAGLAFDVWIPYMMQPQLQGVGEWMLRDRKTRNLLGILRLPAGTSREQLQSRVSVFAGMMSKANPYEDGGMSAVLLPVWKSHFGTQAMLLAPFQILMAVCCVVLLIVCANVGNLLLARFTARDKEFGVRLALGATRGRLARQMFTEGFVLAALATFLGIGMAVFLGGALPRLLPARDLPLALDVSINGNVLWFCILVCAATAILSGIPPMVQAFRANLNDSIKEAGRGAVSGTRSHRLRGALVISEVALALLALIGAGLFVRGFREASHIDPGFDASHVTLAQFALNASGFSVPERKLFSQRLRQKLEADPGVVAVSYSDGAPLGVEPSWWEDLQIRGYQPAPGENMKIYRNVVAPGYFDVLQIPIVEGRDFTEHDDRDTTPVMIVSHSFAQKFFGGGNPLGRQVYGWGRWFTVVGVVKDAKYNNLSESAIPYFYVPFRQIYRADMNLSFYVKTRDGDPNSAIALIRREVRGIDPSIAVVNALPLGEYIGASLYPQRIAATLLAVLGGLSLLLAAVGLYSVMAYSVVQRTREIGIRMALGAQVGDVLQLILRRGMTLAVAGVGCGVLAALVVAPRLANVAVAGPTMGGAGTLLKGNAMDPLIYGGSALFLCAIAALSSYLPARRATKVDPMVTLRYE